jgi:peptide/nickel transport system ATP-binding protein
MGKGEPLLKVENLTKYYTSGYVFTKRVCGAKDVSFSMKRGEVLSLVGESGSGKSTVAKMILRLIKPTSGRIFLDGQDALQMDKKEYWCRVQAVFQDPYSTFNGYYAVDKPLMEAFNLLRDVKGIKYSKNEKRKIIESTLKKIGINPDEVLGRYPHQLSGGQMQRLLVARSLIICPDLLVADEPTSMVDASTRVAVMDEILRLKKERSMSIIFVTHDVGQAYYIGDRAVVMKEGRIVESGPVEDVFFRPKHPYTKELVSSVPPLREKWKI